MGMFDTVNYTADCTRCGVKLKDFQSKDAECELKIIEPQEVSVFYTGCDNCGLWHEFRVVTEKFHIDTIPEKDKVDRRFCDHKFEMDNVYCGNRCGVQYWQIESGFYKKDSEGHWYRAK